MNGICRATKRDGSPCTLPSCGSSGLCWAHDPKNADSRRRGQSRGGRSKPAKELMSIKRRLSELAQGVLEGEIERADAAVAGQLLNYIIRAVGMELKVKEQLELEARLEELESIVEGQNNRRSAW